MSCFGAFNIVIYGTTVFTNTYQVANWYRMAADFQTLTIHAHGLKQLAFGGYSSGFVHIILSVAETVRLVFYELVGGHCYPLTFLKTSPSIL